MNFRSNFSIFLIALFLSTNFRITIQVADLASLVKTVVNSTLANATFPSPSTTTEENNSELNATTANFSTQQPTTIAPTSTPAQLTDEPENSTSTTASNLTSLPPTTLTSPEQENASTFAITNTSGRDFSSPPSTPLEQTTPQITTFEYEVTTQQNITTNATADVFYVETDSTPIDPFLNVTDTSTPGLKMPNDEQNSTTSDIAISVTVVEEEESRSTTESFLGDLNVTNTPPFGGTEMDTSENSVVNSTFITEMELNVTSMPESSSANGTSPPTRNSTERFSDVDATPLLETASMTSSSSLPSLTSTDISSTDTMSTSVEAETTSQPPETTNPQTTTLPSTPTPTVTSIKWFMLQFTGNCTEMERRFEDFKKQIRDKILTKAGISDHQVTLNAINCTNSFLLNVSVSPESEVQLSRFFNNLETTTNSTNKFRISDETYLLNVINSVGDSAYHQPPEVTLSSKHTDIEFVIYVALGSTCVFLLSLAVILVACKYCRSKPYKSFDLNDISHLGLEDFTLTRIPRPKTSIYNDFGAGIGCKNQYSPIDQQGGGNGMVHSYDTSVVPLEDAPNFKNENETEQQIVGKSTQTTPTNHEYEEIDVKAVKSTENLHSLPNAPTKHWGVDNASFSTP